MNTRATKRIALSFVLSAGLVGFGSPAQAKEPNAAQQQQDDQQQTDKKAKRERERAERQQEQERQRKARQQEQAQIQENRRQQQKAAQQQEAARKHQAELEREQRREQGRQQQEVLRQQRLQAQNEQKAQRLAEQERQQTVAQQQREHQAAARQQQQQRQQEQQAQALRLEAHQPEWKTRQERREQWTHDHPRQTERRVAPARQQQLIAQQQRRNASYAQQLERQEQWLQRQGSVLRGQKRMNQYRYQQEYFDSIREQQQLIVNVSSYNYDQDPFFYTAASYRYSYGGRNYETNRYGVEVMQDALNAGYQQGYRAARADRLDHWRYDYRDCYAYRDANYGYNGLYLDPAEYNYYFRQGFQRGYDDGYYSRIRYGTIRDGELVLAVALIDQLLHLHELR